MALATLAVHGRAQTISVSVDLVEVNVSVKDESGRPLRGLQPSDFVLEEDGYAQNLRYFSKDSGLPLSIGLLVDVSGSMTPVLRDVQIASAIFIEHMIAREHDKAFVIRFDREVDLLQSLTPSVPRLKSAVRHLQPLGSIRLSPAGRSCGGFSTTPLYDAIVFGAERLRNVRSARKALVVLTDGEDHNSCTSLQQAIEDSQGSDTIVYIVLFSKPEEHSRGRESALRRMKQIAQATGGQVFEARKGISVTTIYDEIEEHLRELYLLGYVSGRPTDNVEYRKISVKVSKPGVKVISREGYFTKGRNQKE